MANIEYVFKKHHTVYIDNIGHYKIRPALIRSNRLYIIYNQSTARPLYIGIAKNLQNRFKGRLQTMREMGFNQTQLDSIYIIEVQLKLNTKARTPNYIYERKGLDVEHLLIRTYVELLRIGVRNTEKISNFRNLLLENLSWTITNDLDINIPGLGVPGIRRYGLSGGQSF